MDGWVTRVGAVGKAAITVGTGDGEPVLLHAQVGPPPLHGQVIRRDRLLRRLDEAVGVKLVLVACPAGYGKTTLLADWVTSRADGGAAAWVSVDEADNDPVVLWAHLGRALRQANPALADALVDEVTTAPMLEGLMRRLMNALADQPAVTLVLDDVHRIEPGMSRDMLGWFLDHQPETVQLVLSTRAEPGLAVARLRAQGDLLELRASDLRFTLAEGMSMLNERDGLGLAPDDVVSLIERIEGWPAGLYLASLSLGAAADRHSLVARFGASNRHVVDFLVEEVMNSFDQQMQDFMVRTSVLDSLNGPLCDAVLARSGSGHVLAQLARINLFLIPLDEESGSYRYHHLFGQLLKVQLGKRAPGVAEALHRRAMVWYRDHGAVQEAISHALIGGAIDEASEMLTGAWLGLFNFHRYANILATLRRFPSARVSSDPALQLIQAWALAFCGAHAESSQILSTLDSASTPVAGPVAGFSGLESGLRMLRSVFPMGDVGAQLADSRRAAELEGPGSRWWPVSQYALGVSSYFTGDLAEADAHFRVAQSSGLLSGQLITVATSLAYRSLIAGERGSQTAQQELAREADSFVAEHRLTNPLGAVHVAVGVAAAQAGDYESALGRLTEAVDFLRRWGEPLVLVHALIRLAEVFGASGNQGRVPPTMAEARVIVDSCPDPGVLADRVAELELAAPNSIDGTRPLTKRERDVLQRLNSEDSEAEIAASLFVSFNTLHTHVRSAYRKLGVASRRDAVARARVLGVIAD